MDSVFKKNVFRALSSNFISILTSIFIIIVLPKFVGLEEYSYWQLYIFYVSYVGFLHLGWTDGFYLIHAGKDTSELDHQRISANYYSFIFCQIVLSIVLFSLSFYIENEYSKIIFYTSICLLITNIRSYSQFILQASGRIKCYSNILITEKVILFLGILAVLILFDVNYEMVIIIDLLSRLVALLLSSSLCRNILFTIPLTYKSIATGFKDTPQYVSTGFKLMFSFICGLLIFGAVRFTIEIKWGLLVFGEVSLALSITTLFVVFINSISLVLLPMLRNVTEGLKKVIYIRIRFILFFSLLLLFNVYFPLNYFISLWLPDFKNSLIYLSLVFPVMLFESKVSILTNTYMKTLRKEFILLKGNLITLFLSLLFCVLVYFIIDDIKACLVVLVLLSFFRYIYFDLFLSKIMGVIEFKYWFFDALVVVFFIWSASGEYWYFYSLISIAILPLFLYELRKYNI